MNRRVRPPALLLSLAALSALLLAGCGGGDSAVGPLTASAAPPASSTPSATPTPAVSAAAASTPPLSPFEADPAVQGFRAYQIAVADAINAHNLDLPELNALSTTARQARNKVLYGPALGEYLPGPPPGTPLGVRVVSATQRDLPMCMLDEGWTLTKPGGTPTEARAVQAVTYQMVLEAGTWKVQAAVVDPALACANVPIVEVTRP